MARLGRRLLIGTLVFAAIVLVVAVCVAVFLDVNRYKPSIENAVSNSLGMEFRIRGNVALQLLPLPQLKVRDIHLTNGTSELLSAEELQVSPRLIPFILHRRISIDRLALQRPQIRLEQPIVIPLRPGRMSSISVQDGAFSYLDQSSGRSIEVRGLEVKLSDLSLGESDGLQSTALLRSLSFRGTLHATTLQIGTLRASEVRCGVRAEAGLLQLDPTDVTLFGGNSHGSLTLDLRGSSPRIQVVQVAPQIDLGQVFPGEKTYFSGTVQASFDAVGTGTDL
ncbi:MAG: AsmA family protein, partial [Gemmatimonadales bacterium]